MNLTYPWEEYQALQIKLHRGDASLDKSFGLEAASTKLVDLVSDNAVPHDQAELQSILNKQSNSVERRERARRRMLRLIPPPTARQVLPDEEVSHREKFNVLRELITVDERYILIARGLGLSYSEMAVMLGGSANAMKTRVSRIRTKVLEKIEIN